MKAWKVVHTDGDGNLTSFFAPIWSKVKYAVGVTTCPREGREPLAAFRTKKAAIRFRNMMRTCSTKRYFILKSKATQNLEHFRDKNLARMWVYGGMGVPVPYTLVEHTILCDSVTPQEVV